MLSTEIPPPSSISHDEYHAADPARQRLVRKSRFPLFLSLPNLRKSASSSPPTSSPLRIPVTVDQQHSGAQLQSLPDPNFISLDPSGLDDQDEYNDRYEWAIVYENQRGMTIFSIPYYSRLSLLPSDPSPFTIPNSSPKRSEQPPISLNDYPLPDGDWRWVSKCWMIDMRSDSGEVQHDGFEYNWIFRTHKWRAEVGPLSAGGWVRRRRWVRLMMRPAKQNRKTHGEGPRSNTPAPASESRSSSKYRHSVASSLFPSVKSPISGLSSDFLDVDNLWSTDDVEVNWSKCHMIMKQLGRDGRKLELWKAWLRQYHNNSVESDRKGKAKEYQWTEGDMATSSELADAQSVVSDNSVRPIQFKYPPKECLIPILRKYGDAILYSFIYPDSRAELLKELGLVGLLPELNAGLGLGWSASKTDFWSYTRTK